MGRDYKRLTMWLVYFAGTVVAAYSLGQIFNAWIYVLILGLLVSSSARSAIRAHDAKVLLSKMQDASPERGHGEQSKPNKLGNWSLN